MRVLLLFSTVLFLFLNACTKDSATVENSDLVTVNSLEDFQNRTKTGASLVFFHATWCSLCANQRPKVEALLQDNDLKNVFFGQVDFEKNTPIVDAYNVNGFPTILILKDGVVRHALTGSNNSTAKLKELIQAL